MRAAYRRPPATECRLAGLGVGLAAVGLGAVALAAAKSGTATQVRGSIWVAVLLLAAFIAAEWTQLHIEFGRQTFSVSLSELPFVLGLFSLPPAALVVVWLSGSLFISVVRRSPFIKAAFNLGLITFETGIAVLVFASIGPTGQLSIHDWGAAYAASAALDCGGTVAVVLAMSLLQGRLAVRDLWNVGTSVAAAGILNTTLALVVLLVIRENPAAAALLAVIAGITVAGYRGYSSLVRKHTNLGQLYDLSRALTSATSYDELAAALLERCRDVLRAERVVLRDASAEMDPVLRHVAETGRPMIMSRRNRDVRVRSWLGDHGLRDALLVPLQDGTSATAVLQVENRLGEMSTFTSDDVRLLQTIGAHAEAALRGSRLLERLRYDARHDSLTGLGNRTLLFTEVDELLQRGTSSAVLLLDLDRFKEVNDSLGHRIGDLLLGEVARRLVAILPPEATVARLGGDEFAALLPACSSTRSAEAVAGSVRAALCHPFEVANTTLEVGASIGVAMLPDHGHDAVTLLQHADVAMYAAKRPSRGVAVYSSDDDAANLRRLALSRELRRGIDCGELVVHYQPKARLGTGELIGVEALVRWDHPDRGRIMPDEFIPVAEQTGLIGALTERVLRAALLQVREWLDSGNSIGVAVNLSARGLLEPGLPERVAHELAATGVPTELLTLEITESSVMDDFEHAVSVLDQLAALGVSLSLDDFGTGYSSLAYLQRLPVTEVKIDKSFVMSMSTNTAGSAIVRAVIDLGHTLGLTVVAEGVEDETTKAALFSMACDSMQGYLLSRPLPADQLTDWLGQWTRRVPGQQGPRDGVRRLRIVG